MNLSCVVTLNMTVFRVTVAQWASRSVNRRRTGGRRDLYWPTFGQCDLSR